MAYIEFAQCNRIKGERGRIASSCSEERQVIEPNRDYLKPLLETQPRTRINSPFSPLQQQCSVLYFFLSFECSFHSNTKA